ncbi:MAG: HsdR family type I site-specific deoxyribonuclease [Candidatus Contendobacter sp.]|nr:HsdR family type I site-specific deoxyribonuclease [Candidatus Contendobacter sp.]MDG4557610.1 HsdR family type I site-specific deoxyribonuclease [Candidatus Contendobacter sp.]
MTTVGQIEKKTQDRVVALFRDTLGYIDLGNWTDRPNNRNIEPDLLRAWLERQQYDPALIEKALRELDQAANDAGKSLYDRNRAVYTLLRYGVKVRAEVGENTQTVFPIDWKNPLKNDFALAEEVTVKAADAKAHTKRPDVVLYVNGIALGVLELKRSTVAVAEGIRQNLDNQKKEFIQPFFSTVQFVLAGNDTEGLRYGAIETKEKYYLKWVEDSPIENLLDRHLTQLCRKDRFLELIHDFIVFDAGAKKVCRQNQYFGVRAAQEFIRRREGGIIWHTQGSGKSLTMVWLAKWIRENRPDARVLIITDRTELDEQIEKVFKGVNEDIHRPRSGADLIAALNASTPWLMCSLIHKFGGKETDDPAAVADFIAAIRKLPPDFKPKGDLYVFVDECHRTQSGELHQAMKTILPHALFIGFTGTPLLKADKQKSTEVFGRYIHTYKFDQAVREGVVVDLRYEARDIDQAITSRKKIDEWFEAKTQGLNDLARAQLKQKWGTMQRVLSSKSRLEKIVADILLDMSTKPRLMDGHGNALLVSGSIHEACQLYDLFAKTELKGRCAIVTSYRPTVADAKGETTGEGDTDNLRKYETYRTLLADWFDEAPETAINKADEFEQQVKRKFIAEPGQMKLLIVVDKLLTGFDAPPATYLYIDKFMRDHGLFQAICRVNRLDGDDKLYGYIIDYKDLFKSLEGAVRDYTSGALDGYDPEDVAGLLKDRLTRAREDLEEAREAVKALCEPVPPPKDQAAYLHYFCALESGNAEQLKDNEPKRVKLYQCVAGLLRAYANIAGELTGAGYPPSAIVKIKDEVDHYAKVRDEVRLASGDYIDLKLYEPAMRHLIDTYIRAEESEKISVFDDLSLIQLIVERGSGAVDALPEGIRRNPEATAETIENNIRKLIINESPVDPAYYEKMSKLLEALIEQRRTEALDYKAYLAKIAELTKQAIRPGAGSDYPVAINTPARRALYNNLSRDETLALAVDRAVHDHRMDGWRGHPMKTKKIRLAIKAVFEQGEQGVESGDIRDGRGGYRKRGETVDDLADRILELAQNQNEY